MDARLDGPTPAPPVPIDATVFAVSKGTTLAMLLALLMALAEASVLLFHAWFTADPTTRITQVREGIFCLLVAELNWRFIFRSWHRIAVNANGIWSKRWGRTGYLDWHAVANARANDPLQRLELSDSSRNTEIDVEYQVKNFEGLRAFILSHTAESAQVQSPGMTTFHRGGGIKMVYAGLAAALLYTAWLMHQQGGGQEFLVPVVLAAFAVVRVLLDPVRLVISHDSIAIEYPTHQRTIPFSSVKAIAISDVRRKANVSAGVVITTREGRRIRLSQFREGSVALNEALQSAWRATSAAQILPEPASTGAQYTAAGVSAHTVAGAPLQTVPTSSGSSATARRTVLALGIAVIAAVALLASLKHGKVGRTVGGEIARRYVTPPTYEKHAGPIAQVSELKGSGRIYLVQMGTHRAPYSVEDFAKWLHGKYGLDVQVLPAMAIDEAAWNGRRRQVVAELLEAELKQKHPDLAADHDAYLIGFTDWNMYSTREMWDGTFTQRDLMRAAIISSSGMGDTAWQRADLDPKGAVARFQARMRRILLKDVAVLYWHLPVNRDPTSLLHNTLNPDLPTEDIYESDVNPALSAKGEAVDEPCIFFTYSSNDGMQPLPGPVIRDCSDVQDPMEDEQVELFELDLRLGLLIDKHTDLYLPDTIPIEFQRVTRDGERGRDPFGISGWDNYDEFLGSADNIHIFVEHADGGRDNLVRVPQWLPVISFVKYVGGQSAGIEVPGSRVVRTAWQYEMAWHAFPFEHYDVRRFNGGIKTYLPCNRSSVNCSLVGYQDSQGRELKIERNSSRRLARITSPNGNWVGVGTGSDGRILAIDDSRGRTVHYTYDGADRLTGVTYPSGETHHYDYDYTQHMLTFRIATDAHSEPRVVLSNEYENGLLTKQTLGDGGTYTYTYDSSNPETIRHATVETPGGRRFTIEIGAYSSIVREQLSPNSAKAVQTGRR